MPSYEDLMHKKKNNMKNQASANINCINRMVREADNYYIASLAVFAVVVANVKGAARPMIYYCVEDRLKNENPENTRLSFAQEKKMVQENQHLRGKIKTLES